MKALMYLQIAILAGSALWAQESAVYDTAMPPISGASGFPTVSREEFKLTTIRNIMNSPHPLQRGHVQLHRMGDDAAVAIMKVLAKRDRVLSRNDFLTILDMVRIAFEQPACIVILADRTPQATLFLLSSLDQSTDDKDLKEKILATKKQFVDLEPAKP